MKYNDEAFRRFVRVAADRRQLLNLSQKNIADFCGVTHQTVSNFERGECFNYVLTLYYLSIMEDILYWIDAIFKDNNQEDML